MDDTLKLSTVMLQSLLIMTWLDQDRERSGMGILRRERLRDPTTGLVSSSSPHGRYNPP